ncbi:unnamed protein product [Symbiodinium natans]|uniref:Uncharacterized protein n=1 Tax=Symbiodinium natans TaxID=878477 RepID=A0A812TMS4_9DINO|nr:unnamed protein product [Symbiodinium natans]
MREPWTEAFAPLPALARDDRAEMAELPVMLAKTCMATATCQMASIKRILHGKTWNNDSKCRQTWHGCPWRFDETPALKKDCGLSNELHVTQPAVESAEDCQEQNFIEFPSRFDSNATNGESACLSLTPRMPQDAEANLRDAEAAMKKDETDAKKPERCELKQESDESIASIVTSRGGASFHTASWVVRDVREPREARKQVERVEPCGGSGSGGYRSALDLLRELRELSELSAQPAQPAQPAHLGTRHKKRGQALSNPGLPLVMEHHHVHRYRHRHHRQVVETEEEAMLAALKVPKTSRQQPEELTVRLPALNTKQRVPAKRNKEPLHKSLSLPVLRHRHGECNPAALNICRLKR